MSLYEFIYVIFKYNELRRKGALLLDVPTLSNSSNVVLENDVFIYIIMSIPAKDDSNRKPVTR